MCKTHVNSGIIIFIILLMVQERPAMGEHIISSQTGLSDFPEIFLHR